MLDDARVQGLVEAALEARQLAEDVCRDCPELLPEVRRRLEQVRAARADLQHLFPTTPLTTAYSGDTCAAAAAGLPQIPGYDVLEELGRGGMGVVYKARQFAPERLVALKVIRSGELATAENVRLFRQEANEAARLDHPNIVPVYEVGEHDGLHFFTMKLVEGGGLNKHLERYQSDVKTAARLAATAARAVHYAHQRQLLHRDLKPGNILLDAAGQPHVADFGLAKRMGGAGEASQSAGAGTPEYMAPEQARGDARLTTAADVYGLGGVLYALLAGRPPFRGASAWATIEKVLTEAPTPPSKERLGVPRDLETICLKCLAKEPARRYGSAEALAEDLERWLRGEPVRARPVGAVERLAMWARRRPALAAAYGLLLAALVLGAGGGGATWLWLQAEKARGDAVEARGRAESAQREAESARARAETAEGEAKDAKRKLTQYAYADRVYLAQREWDAGQVKRARELLDDAGVLQEELTPGRRPWEWDYLNRDFHQELAVLEGHTGPVFTVAFSPDGERLATGSGDGTVRLWDAASGKPQTVLLGPGPRRNQGRFTSVAFSPDGGRLAAACIGTEQLWDAVSGKPVAVLTLPADMAFWKEQDDVQFGVRGEMQMVHVWFVAFSRLGSCLTFPSDDGKVELWDAASGKPLATLRGHTAKVVSVAFSLDGGRVATGSEDGTARLWDAASGKPLAVLQGHTGVVHSVAISPDGGRVATASSDKTARLWDAASGKQLAVLEGHTDEVWSVAFSPDGDRVATGSDDASVRLWDAASGKPLPVLQGHTDRVVSVAFSPDGSKLASGSYDNTVRLWDAASSKQLADLQGRTDDCVSVAFSPDDGHLAKGCDDGTASVWDAACGKPLAVLRGHMSRVVSGTFSPDGRRVATGSEDGTVRLWDAATGRPLAVLQGAGKPLAFSPDGSLVTTGSNDRTARLWEAASGKPLAVLQGHTSEVLSGAFSPDGSHVATGSSDRTARLWDAASGKPLAVLQGHTQGIDSVAFSPGGDRFATGSWDHTARLWDAASGKPLAVLEGHTNQVLSVAFSPDGGRLATRSMDFTIRLWDVASGKPLCVLQALDWAGWSVAFSGDGSRLAASSSDGTVRLWIARESTADQDKRRHFWQEQQAADAEKGGRWFAAAFHLDRLIDETPDDDALYARRCGAEIHLGRWQPAAADFFQALMRWPAGDEATSLR